MGYVQLAVAVFSLAKEIFKYLSAEKTCNKELAGNVKEFKAKLKTANKSGDTKDVEKMFADLGIIKPK